MNADDPIAIRVEAFKVAWALARKLAPTLHEIEREHSSLGFEFKNGVKLPPWENRKIKTRFGGA